MSKRPIFATSSTSEPKKVKQPMSVQAIPWITIEDGVWAVNPEASKFLETKCSGPVSVVSVGGRYRGGKSFLLNRGILDNPQAFGVGNTTRACTKVMVFRFGC